MSNSRIGIRIDPTANVHPTALLEGDITVGAHSIVEAGTILSGIVKIGHHVNVQYNAVLRGRITVRNLTHIYDPVKIESGRPQALKETSATDTDEEGIIGDYCWLKRGAVMHGTHLENEAAVGGNTSCDYRTRIRKAAIPEMAAQRT